MAPTTVTISYPRPQRAKGYSAHTEGYWPRSFLPAKRGGGQEELRRLLAADAETGCVGCKCNGRSLRVRVHLMAATAGTDARADPVRLGLTRTYSMDPGSGSPSAPSTAGEGLIGHRQRPLYHRAGGHRWFLNRVPGVLSIIPLLLLKWEWRILNALEGTPAPAPRPSVASEDVEVIGVLYGIYVVSWKVFTPIPVMGSLRTPKPSSSLAWLVTVDGGSWPGRPAAWKARGNPVRLFLECQVACRRAESPRATGSGSGPRRFCCEWSRPTGLP